MPETKMRIAWSDGTQQDCYSPSLVIKKYFTAGEEYELSEFVELARTALNTASDRVKAAYGYSCSKALGQLQQIEDRAGEDRGRSDIKVRVIDFIDI